jgi:2-polyprenyl-3-methyl-5-hydroxy-6-metoxy-1,4-benzoquinol methylase
MTDTAQPSIAEQVDYYDERFTGFTYANRLRLARANSILSNLVRTKLLEPRIVDLGCGGGWLSGILGVFGPTLGVDLSQAAVEEAQARHPHVRFEAANLFDWKFEPGCFDVVVSQEVIEHVADQPGYLELCSAVLKPGGYLILTTPNADTFYAMPENVRRNWSNQPIEDWRTLGELRALLAKRFEIISLSSIILGYGVKGAYRYANSRKLRTAFGAFGLTGAFDRWREDRGFGLHSVAFARKQ